MKQLDLVGIGQIVASTRRRQKGSLVLLRRESVSHLTQHISLRGSGGWLLDGSSSAGRLKQEYGGLFFSLKQVEIITAARTGHLSLTRQG